MSADVEHFDMPREQYPTWAYSKVFPRRDSPEDAGESVQRHFFFWARNGIYYGLQALGISSGSHVLVPAYVCTAAVEPFTAYGTEVGFYSIGRNCEPDFAEIESKISPRTQAILAVHYFGFPQKIQALRELCTRRNIILIEDCAHVLGGKTGGRELGSFGDASIFSWRKCLPLYDGAELRLNRKGSALSVNWSKETLPFTLKVAKSLVDRILEQSDGSIARIFSGTLEAAKTLWRRGSSAPSDRPLLALDSNRASFDSSLLNQPISRVSRWLLKHSDVSAVIKKRRDNYLYLQKELRDLPGIELLHRELDADTCPWVMPIFFKGLPNAHFLLRKDGIPAVTWGGVRPQNFDSKQFPVADFLYDNLVFLPIHQNLSLSALRKIVSCVASIGASQKPNKPQGDFAVA